MFKSSRFLLSHGSVYLFLFAALVVLSGTANGRVIGPDTILEVTTEIQSMHLTGTGGIPLGRATGSAQPNDIDGYRFVDTQIDIYGHGFGKAQILAGGCGGVTGISASICTTDTTVHDGDTLKVNSFFDIFFDVTLTDVDPTNDFMGPGGIEFDPGTQLGANGFGPIHMVLNGYECTADTSKAAFGCLPPTGGVYLGHFNVKLDATHGGYIVDINGNGKNDTVKFTLAAHSVGGVTNTFLDGTSTHDTFNSSANLDGLIGDDFTDPPFSIPLGGPVNGIQTPVPEPASVALLLGGLGIAALVRRRKK